MARRPGGNSRACSVVHFQEADAFYTFVSYEGSDRIEKKHCNIPDAIYDSLAELADAINCSNEQSELLRDKTQVRLFAGTRDLF